MTNGPATWATGRGAAPPSRWSAPAAGARLADRYVVLETLGTGGMGVVVVAHDEMLDRRVAVKLVHQAMLDASPIDILEDEARALARVCHPNVVQVHEMHVDCEPPVLVMELVEGGSLEARIAQGPPSIADALHVIEGIAAGLTAIHQAGLVHGDVKPPNVLLAPGGEVKLTDLGLGPLIERLARSRGASTSYLGTPGYAAPERARGLAVPPELRPRADVYSLAVVAHELLTGVRAEPEHVSHATRPIPSLATVRPLSSAFDAPLLAALRVTPRERTATPMELVRGLRDAAACARPDGAPHRFLLVGPAKESRDALADALAWRFHGSKILTTDDPLRAIALVEDGEATAVIVDLTVRGMERCELTRRLRGVACEDELPIVIVAGEGSVRDWSELRACGATRFFVEPLVIEDVLDLLARGPRVSSVPPAVLA